MNHPSNVIHCISPSPGKSAVKGQKLLGTAQSSLQPQLNAGPMKQQTSGNELCLGATELVGGVCMQANT